MYMGIDGGGTGTRGALLDATGQIIGEAEAGPANAIVVGIERAFESVLTVYTHLRDIAPGRHIFGTVVGLAGVDRPYLRLEWIRRLDHLVVEPYWLVGDYQLAWAALTHGQPGLIGIVGTGSVFFGDNGTNPRRIGGYGWQIGDVGSGIRLGQLGTRAALEAMDGAGTPTVLVNLVQEFFKTTAPAEILSHWYDKRFEVQQVAQLAGPILDAAQKDFAARRLVEAEASGIVANLWALAVALGWKDRWAMGIAGGLADRWLPWIERSWHPYGHRTKIQTVTERPVIGATWLAKHWTETGRRRDNSGQT